MRPCRVSVLSSLLLSWLQVLGQADEPKSASKSRIWENYAAQVHRDLNTQFNGELTPVFRTLGDAGELYEYFDKDRNPNKYEAYRQLLIQSLADSLHKDVVEAMFADVLIELTPSQVLLAMIAPEIGPEGKLRGILKGKHSSVAKYIQRQPQQGNLGTPNFDEYVQYLKGNKARGFTSQVNAEIIVDHMLRTDPQVAFMAMLWADYGFNPHAISNAYSNCGEDTATVRNLQLSYAIVCEYLARARYSLPVREDQADSVATELRRLVDHDRWWVRQYVACLFINETRLRHADLFRKLQADRNEHVKAVLRDFETEQRHSGTGEPFVPFQQPAK